VGDTFAQVLPLAIGVAISPVILALQIAALASARRPLARALAVFLGVAVVAVAVVLGVAALDHHAVPVPRASHWVVAGWIRIAIAIVLVGVAVRFLVAKHAEPTVKAGPEVGDDSSHLVRFAALGAAAMVSDSVMLIPAAHDAAVAPIPTGQRVTVLAVVTVVALLPAYGPMLAAVLTGTWGLGLLVRFGAWFQRHLRTIAIVGALVFAAYLALTGWIDLGKADRSPSTSGATTTTTTGG